MNLGRNSRFSGGLYRYGFNCYESDYEVKEAGNSVNYKYRMHSLYRLFGNPRLGRFFAVDPLNTQYPHWSPYTFSGNQVILTVELEGLEPSIDINKAKPGEEYQGTNKQSSQVAQNVVYNWVLKIEKTTAFDGTVLENRSWEKKGQYTGPNINESAILAENVYDITKGGQELGDKVLGTDYKLTSTYSFAGLSVGIY
jgi:hypothetical protein